MQPNISIVSNLIGDKARSRMLIALMGGKALTATELSLEADITAQTASSHLAKLLDGKLIVVRKQGRHKYFQLASRDVADVIEQLLTLTSSLTVTTQVHTGPNNLALRKARVCYDHLAGEVGVKLYDTLVSQSKITDNIDSAVLTQSGELFFTNLGADLSKQKQNKRPLCKACLDLSERRNHLAGQLGQWILNDILEKGWAVKDTDSRAIRFTAKGTAAFTKTYQIGT